MSLEIFEPNPFVNYFFFTVVANDEEHQLSLEDRRRRDRRYPRIAICRYSECPFVYLFRSGNDQALLNCCGVDHKTFRVLLDLFETKFHQYTLDENTGRLQPTKGQGNGRKREIDAVGALGLVLFWFRTRGSVARAVALAFGLTSTASKV